MKKILTFLVLTINSFVFSQNSLRISYNSTMSGRNISTNYSIPKGDNNFTLGMRFNINRLHHVDDQFKTFVKRLYATKPIHYFGINFSYERKILKKWDLINPFLFYDLQFTYSTTRNRSFLPYSFDTTENITLYKEHINYFGPFYWLENTIGFGLNIDVTKKLYINQKIGFGRTLVLGYDEKLLNKLNKTFNWFSSEFGGILSLSLGYKF